MNQGRIIVITGSPGTGKTTTASIVAKETMKRAVERSKLDRKTNIELVETMWEQFSGLGIYESNVIDTTTFTIKDTVSAIKERVACGTSLLS